MRYGGCLMMALVLAGCGEYRQAVGYQDGAYQGKRDQRVWDNARALHDPAMWRQMIHERNQFQNEYERIENGGQR